MSFLLTAVFENGFCELYLPSVDNKTVPMEIKPSVSGRDEDVILPLEVWDGVWTLTGQGFQITRQEDPLPKAELQAGMLLNCELPDGQVFSLTVEEVTDGNTQFTKYFLDPSVMPRISIGSGEGSVIRYGNQFASPKHAEMVFMDGGAELRDLGSVNGTFVNGRMLTGSHPLKYGDVIYIIGLKIIYLGNVLAINNPKGACAVSRLKAIQISSSGEDTGEAAPDAGEERYFLRTPRRLETLDETEFTVEKCPPKQKQKRQPLLFTIGPAFTMVIPMAVGAMLSAGSGFGMAGIIMSAGAALVGAIWAIINVRYEDKAELEAENHRTEIYTAYIEKITKKLREKLDYNRAVLVNRYPPADAAADFAITGSHRLWEKSSSHGDFLDVRLGTGDIPSPNAIHTPPEQAMAEHDPLNDKVEEIQRTMSVLQSVPVSLSLYDNRFVGIVSGDRERALNLARALTVQLAAAHPYTDLRMCAAYPPKESDQWDYIRYLPHVWAPDGKLRLLCCDRATVGDVMYFLSTLIRERLESQPDKKDDNAKLLPHYVVIVADWSLVENEPIAKYLMNPKPEMGLTTVLLADSSDKLPNTCTAIIRDDDQLRGFYSTANAFPAREKVAFDSLSVDKAERFARCLSQYHVRESGSSTAIPELLTFLDMYRTSTVETLDMYHKWLENRTYESMRALIGYKAGNQPLYLDIHEKYHGPHGLVAGTTGSGKSETLQSYILSLVINYHPDEVAFVLIDYKGGGMAQSFEGLPHLSGVITNLGGNATNRALLSINAEIRRRQRIFNEYKVKHIDAYIELYRAGTASEPMPHLLIIADEFAELKKEQPEFVRALVSAARVGRSLGVNLILATQKPSGVVDDEIWSNTRFRLCLRVADKQDSNEMLKRPDAAAITGTGRGFFQVGNDEIFEEFQSGWSGAAYEPEIPFTDEKNVKVELLNIIGHSGVPKKKKKKKSDNIQKVTQLDAVVRYAAAIAKENGIAPVRQIWLPPLPKKLYLEELTTEPKPAGFSLRLPIGLADNPETQSQYPVYVDFLADGHLLCCGASGSGKTTLLQTMLYSAVTRYTAKEVNFYIMDFSSRTMAVFSALPHVGAVCFDGDDEKLDDTFELLQSTLEKRKALFSSQGIGSFKEYVLQHDDCPAIVLIIDNFPAFSDSYEQFEDALALLSREGASYGIYLVLTSNASGDLRSRLRQNFSCGIALQMPDRFEYEAVVGDHTEIVPEGRTTGRGLVKAPAPVEFQTALAVREEPGMSQAQTLRRIFEQMAKTAGSGVKKVGQSVESLSFKALIARDDVKALPEPVFALGLTTDGQELITADFDQEYCYTVGGSGKTGKTNLLKALALEGKAKGSRLFLFDNAAGELTDFANELGFDGAANDAAGLFSLMESVIVPEFTARNQLVSEARDQGKSVTKALGGTKRILFLINDMSAFINAVYSPDFEMSDFFELALEKGREHKISFAAAVTPDDWADLARYQTMRQFAAFGRGIHLGGLFDQQSILQWKMSAADAVRQLPAGVGYALATSGDCVRLLTPLTEGGSK